MIFIIKVTTNKEDRAADMIAEKAQKKQLEVYSIARPHGLKGYIILEALDKDNAKEAVYNLPYVKGIIGKTVEYQEVKDILEPTAETMNIEKNDIVEIISEAFKNEKAKILRIDKQKGEAIINLLEAAIPISVTVKLDNLKVIRRDKAEEENKEEKE